MKFFFCCLTILLPLVVFSQSSDELKVRRLDSLFRELNSNKMSMGSISIFKNGKEFYSNTYGIANIKDNKEILSENDKTLYRIGSVSKIFTAWLIMDLVENGKLFLDQTVESFFPGLHNASNISIRQMLAHKSLLPVYIKVDDLEKLRKAKTTEALINTVNKAGVNEDTSRVKYNNLNYILLGLIIEKLHNKTYNEVLASKLEKAGPCTVYGTYHYLDHLKGQANSFHLDKDKWEEDYEISESPVTDGSGFLLADARSLNRFMQALFTYKLIGKETVDQMLPNSSAFGYGLMKTNFGKHKGYGHSGRIEGFTSATSYYPNEQISISFLQNGSVYPLNDILIMVGNIIFDEPFTMPQLKKIELTKEQQNKLFGTYKNEETGYKVIIDENKGELRLRVAKGNGLLNKMILDYSALSPTRLFNPGQGIFFDFIQLENGQFQACEMRVNGSTLVLTR